MLEGRRTIVSSPPPLGQMSGPGCHSRQCQTTGALAIRSHTLYSFKAAGSMRTIKQGWSGHLIPPLLQDWMGKTEGGWQVCVNMYACVEKSRLLFCLLLHYDVHTGAGSPSSLPSPWFLYSTSTHCPPPSFCIRKKTSACFPGLTYLHNKSLQGKRVPGRMV